MSKKKTDEEFRKELKEVNPNIEPLEEYYGTGDKIKVKCKICNNIWEARPYHLVGSSKSGCPKCAINNLSKIKTKSNNKFLKELKLKNPDITPLEEYKGLDKEIKVKCNKCGYEYYEKPRALIYGSKKCQNCKNLTTDEFSKNVSEIHEYIKLIGEYENNYTKVLCKCLICNNEFWIRPYELLGGVGCPNRCIHKIKQYYSKVDYLQDNYSDEWEFYLDNINPLKNKKGLIKCTCKNCGKNIEKTYRALYQNGLRCNNCNPTGSIEEQRLADGIKEGIDEYINKKVDELMGKKLTNEEFLKRFNEKYKGRIVALTEYVKYATKIKFKCNECGDIFYAKGYDMLQYKHGCANCNGNKKRTREEFVELMEEVDSTIEIIGTYINNNTRILCKCKKCGNEWYAEPKRLLAGNGCNSSECISEKIRNSRLKYDTESFKKIAKENYPNLELLDEYYSYDTKVKFLCKDCGEILEVKPSSVIRKTLGNCPNCLDRIRIENHYKKLKAYSSDFNFKVLGKLGWRCDIECTCKKCNTKVIKDLQNITNNGIVCKTCNPTGSVEEQRLADNISEEINKQTNELKELYKMERNVRMSDLSGRQFEIDIYFPNLKLGFEYDGVYYHSDKVRYARYILDKKEFFWDNFGIHIIFVNSIEYNYNPDVVQDKIMSALNIYKKLAYARKLKVIEVDYETSTEFLELNHIQGGDSSGVRFGLVTKKTNVLVALMTFSKVRNIVKSKSDNEDTYELVRYCVMKGLKITGGFSKLLKHAEKYLQSMGVKYIKTFADRRFTKDSDNVYLRNGFELSNISGQNYLYFKNEEVLTRYQCQKHKLRNLLGEENFDESMTERENMLFNGYSVYWDCGNLVYYKEIK